MIELVVEILKDVWVYYLLYAICFTGSLYFMINFFEKDIDEKDKRNLELIEENNNLIDKYNKLADDYNALGDKYNKLYDYYEIAYSKYNHILSVQQICNGKSVVTFVQVFYTNNSQMMCMATRVHESGKITSIKFGESK